jgi:ribokinase
VVRTARLPAPCETVLGRDFAAHPGGKGANQAVACARAGGAPTRMLLALGEDANAAVLEASLGEAGVRQHVVRVPGIATGVALIGVADDGENSIVVASGANRALRPEHLPPLAGVSHLLMQLESPLDSVAAWARQAHAAGVTVVLNAAPATALPEGALAQVDVLVVNEVELAQLSPGGGDVEAAMRRLGVPVVVATLGARGCVALTPQGVILQPAHAVTVVDTTAAGDTFCGVLVAALAQQRPWPEALRRASVAAALACTRAGAQSSIPTRAEVDRLVEAA